jgi:Fur family transcriptional regulator, ferric uptake regulator
VDTSPDTAERAPGRTRSTRQSAAIEGAMRDADGFRTAQQLFDVVRANGQKIGLTTVYRHLNLLAEHGTVDVVHLADGEAQFRLCGSALHDAEAHHHHVVCRVCGRSEEVAAPEVETWADRVARAAGYTDISHTVEIFGLCPQHSK